MTQQTSAVRWKLNVDLRAASALAYPFCMSEPASVKVKGGALLSRLSFVRDRMGEDGVRRVLDKLAPEDREAFKQVLTGGWYPFAVSARLDEAVASEMGMGEQAFLLMGEKSAEQNLGGPHRAMLTPGDPHGLLRRSPQIYQMYYDTGRRTYERAGERKAIIRTYEAELFSKHDCLTVVGWYRKAIAMCDGMNPRVQEVQCRAAGAEFCEYVCEWS